MADVFQLTFLGTGTSMGVPVIGCHCETCSSADVRDQRLRTSVLIEYEGQNVVVDSGPDFRQQMLRFGVERLSAIVYTHEHKDHTAGMDDVRAYNFIQNSAVNLYASERVEAALRHDYHYAFADTKYPGVPEITFHRIDYSPFTVGGLEWKPIQVMHHRLPVLGFRIGKLVYITDANFIPDDQWPLIQGCEVLVLNALRKSAHISHFTLDEAVSIAEKSGAKQCFLTHISHQMGPQEAVEKELPAHVRIAYDGLKVSCNL